MKMKSVKAVDLEFSAVGFGAWAAGGGDIWNATDDRWRLSTGTAATS
jgi:aryl-alcohol dehydrogenase-like predicted oxidoreductase